MNSPSGVRVFDAYGHEVDPAQNPYPARLNDTLKRILGMPNFACIPYAQSFRRLGYRIDHKAEEEQAFTIDWLLRQYLKGGAAGVQLALREIDATINGMNRGDTNCIHELQLDEEMGDGRAKLSCSKCGYECYRAGGYECYVAGGGS